MNSHGDNMDNMKDKDIAAAGEVSADPDQEENPEKRAEQLEHEIEEIRDNLGGLVRELDHRRHRLNPLNAISHYPWPVALGSAALLGLVVGGVVLHRARARERDSLLNRGKRLQSALRRAMDKPDKVAETEPNVGMKVLTTMATAVAAVAARRLASRIFAQPS
ncbi:MAG: hypothetical protein ABIS92_04095 [Polyangia bacterium]